MSTQVYLENSKSVQIPKHLLEDLFQPKMHIFWLDLSISATVGYSFFTLACLAKPLSWSMFITLAISAIAFYRCSIFIHEISHLKSNAPTGFVLIWNLIIGIPLLLPSFIYTGVHQDHHRLSTYGTVQDPEYKSFAGKPILIILFLASSLLIPALLLIRFLFLSPLGLLFPPLHCWLEKHASSLSMNLDYSRQVSNRERLNMKRVELAILGMWGVPLILITQGIVSVKVLVIWYVIMAVINTTNSLRTLVAHRYQSTGKAMDRDSQLLDSIDTPGSFWTVIWAPVGLRYHALHHYFPSIPYHNLPIARERLRQALPPDSPYCLVTSPSLWHSFKALWITARARSEKL